MQLLPRMLFISSQISHTKVKPVNLAFSFGIVFLLHCFFYNGEIKVSKLNTTIPSSDFDFKTYLGLLSQCISEHERILHQS